MARPERCKRLAKALGVENALTDINIFNNYIAYHGAVAIADALQNNTTLKSLELRHNDIEDDGAKAFADVLQHNNTLTSLNLSNNKISDTGIHAICKSLEFNKSLKKLDLSHNQISDSGVRSLVHLVETNTTVKDLCINYSDKKISSKSKYALIDALKNNKTLSSFTFWNDFDSTHIMALAQISQFNQSLSYLSFSGMAPTLQESRILTEAMKTNYSIGSLNPDPNNELYDSFIQRNRSIQYHQTRLAKNTRGFWHAIVSNNGSNSIFYIQNEFQEIFFISKNIQKQKMIDENSK